MAITREQKKAQVTDLKAEFDGAESVILVDYKGLDVPQLVESKVAAFAIEKLEKLILEVAARELRAIVVLGGVLGALIGLCQVGFLWFRATQGG